jgi:hypothetical protein
LGNYVAMLEEATNACVELTMFFAQAATSGNFLVPVLYACKFMEIFGDVILGHFLLDGALVAAGKLAAIYEAKGAESIGRQKGLQRTDKDAAFYSGRIASAKFFANEVLTTVKARCQSIQRADKTPLEVTEEAFAG